MADRILTWYVDEVVGDGTHQGPTFILDRDYDLPGIVRIYAGDVPDANVLQVDIKDDGVSLFTSKPTVHKKQHSQDWWENFDDSLHFMEKYSLISLDVTSGGAKKITVQLELTASLGASANEGVIDRTII